MKKRIASLLMAVVMLASLSVGSLAATTEKVLVQGNTSGLSAANFKDLADATKPDGRHWAWDAIDHVVKFGLFNGTSATTFAPQNGMTRAQFVVVITRLENTSRTGNNKLNVERVPTKTRFTDVPEDMWCAGAVAWAEANGIVEGYSDNTFKPNQVISRAQIAAFVYRYVNNYKKYTLKVVSPTPAQFTDYTDAHQVFRSAIDYCRTHGLIQGYGDHSLKPNIAVTRAQVAAILSRIILVLSSGRGGGGGGFNPLPTPTAQTTGVQINAQNSVGATVAIEKWDTASGKWIPLIADLDDNAEHAADYGNAAAATVYRVVIVPDTANGYEFESFTVTDKSNYSVTSGTVAGTTTTINYATSGRVPEATSGSTAATPYGGMAYGKAAAGEDVSTMDPAPAQPRYKAGDYVAIYWFRVLPGGFADVDVVIKQYGDYSLEVQTKAGSSDVAPMGVDKLNPAEPMMEAAMTLNNNLTGSSWTNADTLESMLKTFLFTEDEFGDFSTSNNDHSKIEISGDTLEKVLKSVVDKEIENRLGDIVSSVSSATAAAGSGSFDWQTEVEKQVTGALQQQTGNTNFTAKLKDGEKAKVSFQIRDDSRTALTNNLTKYIRDQVDAGKLKISADLTSTGSTVGGVKEYYIQAATNGSIAVESPVKSTKLYVEMKYNGSTTGPNGPAYETYYGDTKLSDWVKSNPAEAAALGLNKVPTSGNVALTNAAGNGLNDYTKTHPVDISNANLGLNPITNFPTKAVSLKYILNKDTVDNNFQKMINHLETAAQTPAKAIYTPNKGGDSTSGYIKVYGAAADNGNYVINRITVGGDTLVETYPSGDNGSEHDKIRVYTDLKNWKGADTALVSDAKDDDYSKESGKHFDELLDLSNNVRLKMSAGWIADSVNNSYKTPGASGKKKILSITTNLTSGGPSEQNLRDAVSKTMAEQDPVMADLFRYLGDKAAGVTSITITVGKENVEATGTGMKGIIGKILGGDSVTVDEIVTIGRQETK